MTEEEKHIRRMKNPAYASGYHLGFADGFKQGEDSVPKQFETMVIDGYENEIKLLKKVIELQKIGFEQEVNKRANEKLDKLFEYALQGAKLGEDDWESDWFEIKLGSLYELIEELKK